MSAKEQAPPAAFDSDSFATMLAVHRAAAGNPNAQPAAGGSYGAVAALQRAAGNRATAAALGPAHGMPVQRSLAVGTAYLGKGRAGKTYAKLKQRLTQYHAERGAEEKYGLLVAMQGLIDDWKKKHASDHTKHAAKHRQRLDTLQTAITLERPTAMTHASYVARMRYGRFKYLSGEAKPERGAAGGLIRGQVDPGQTEQGQDEKALKKLEKYALTEAEVLAIKVYTVGDYALINPAVEGGARGGNRLQENLPWLGGQLPLDIRPGEKPADNAPAAEKQKWDDKKKIWDAAVAQLVAQADWNSIKRESLEHAGMLQAALLKLHKEKCDVWRGMRLTQQEFDLEWKTSNTEVKYPSFLSTSKYEAKGKQYAKRREGKLGVLLFCHLKSARDVENLSAHRSEGEMIVIPPVKLYINKVTKVTGEDHDWLIEVTEV